MINKLYTFVSEERNRFSNMDNNLFATSFSKIARYCNFLSIIIENYKTANIEFIQNVEAKFELAKQGQESTLNPKQQLFNDELLFMKLHLHLESFYTFSKILLDNVARTLEFYFGKARNLSLDSHHKFLKNIKNYIEVKKLTPFPSKLEELTIKLQDEVSDYRDKEITHEKSPRTIKGTAFSHITRESRLFSTKLYPKEDDKQVEGKSPEEIMNHINQYISEIIDYISNNRDKTNLTLET